MQLSLTKYIIQYISLPILTGVKPKENKNALAKIEAMKKGYSAFVKKGTAAPGDVFKPSCTTHMSAEKNIFDQLMKTTTDLKSRSDLMEVGREDDTGVVNNQQDVDKQEDANNPEPEETYTVERGVAVVRDHSVDDLAKAVSIPTPPPLVHTVPPLQNLKPLPPNRVSAISATKMKSKDTGEMSEGECTDSDDDKMET